MDYAPTFLSCCGIDIPAEMTGIDQRAVWNGDDTEAREHVIVENRHQPTTLHMKTYIDERYKLTLYCNRDYGEIFDLSADPGEVNNLYDDASLRAELTEAMLRVEMLKEELLSKGQSQHASQISGDVSQELQPAIPSDLFRSPAEPL